MMVQKTAEFEICNSKVSALWEKGSWEGELVCDPASLFWNAATIDQCVAQARALTGAPDDVYWHFWTREMRA